MHGVALPHWACRPVPAALLVPGWFDGPNTEAKDAHGTWTATLSAPPPILAPAWTASSGQHILPPTPPPFRRQSHAPSPTLPPGPLLFRWQNHAALPHPTPCLVHHPSVGSTMCSPSHAPTCVAKACALPLPTLHSHSMRHPAAPDADDEASLSAGTLTKDTIVARFTDMFGEVGVTQLGSDDWKVSTGTGC